MNTRGVTGVLAGLAILAAGCGSTAAGQGGAANDNTNGQELVVGVSNSGLNAPFPVAIKNGIQAKAEKLGVKVIQLDAQLSDTKQAGDINTLIAQQVDGILLSPNSQGSAVSMVAQANNAGIPIAIFHGQAGTGPIDQMHKGVAFRVSEQEVRAGRLAAQMALDAAPDGGKVAIITGSPGFTAVEQRMKDFRSVIKSSDNYEIVATQTGEWTPTGAYNACQSILTSHPDLALFYTESDDMAVGCAKAAKAKSSDAEIVSVGGQKAVLDLIKKGAVYGTVCYQPYTEGRIAMRMMHELLTGEKKYDGELVFYETPAVTKDNLSQCEPQW